MVLLNIFWKKYCSQSIEHKDLSIIEDLDQSLACSHQIFNVKVESCPEPDIEPSWPHVIRDPLPVWHLTNWHHWILSDIISASLPIINQLFILFGIINIHFCFLSSTYLHQDKINGYIMINALG